MARRKTIDTLGGEQRARFSDALASQGDGVLLVEQRVIPLYFKEMEDRDVYPVATDTFIGKSKETYTPGWLTREIVQNFVDHNAADPGTLNGVRVDIIDRSTDPSLPKGAKRFVITGSWKFEKPTGIISFHSDKPADIETAGGNGIGLKQTALRFLRDFDVNEFTIEGEKWRVNYELARAEQINASLPEGTPTVDHDWLVADLEKTTNTGETRYIIETADPVLIAALDQFEEIGVKDTNRFLAETDVSNEKGSIRWLDPKEEGRLFMNGQAFHYEQVGKTPETYFSGPKGVVLRLNNVKYRMSIDRPPLQSYDMKSYSEEFVRSLTGEQLVDQLFASSQQWLGNGAERYGAVSGALKLVECIVGWIKLKEQTGQLDVEGQRKLQLFRQLCAEKKLLAVTGTLGKKEKETIAQDGYILCPSFFADIGMSVVESIFSEHDRLEKEKPQSVSAYEKLSRARHGVEVASMNIEAEDIGVLVDQIKKNVETCGGAVTAGDTATSIVMHIPCSVPDTHAFEPLIRPKNEEEKRLLWARGIIVAGIEKGLFTRAFMKQGEYVVSCGIDEKNNTLLVKVIDNSASGDKRSGLGVFVDCASVDMRGLFDGTLSDPAVIESIRSTKELAKKIVKHGRSVAPGTYLPPLPIDGRNKNREEPRSHFVAKSIKWGAAALGALGLAGLVRLGIDSYNANSHSDSSDMHEGGARGVEGQIQEYLQDPRQQEMIVQNQRELTDWLDQHGGAGHSEDGATITFNQLFGQYRGVGVLPRSTEFGAGGGGMERGVPENDAIENFEIVEQPSQAQVVRLELLRRYIAVSVGLNVPNNLFVYTGRGALGVNFTRQNSIGIHAEVLDGNFESALQTFVHEVSHNHAAGHDNEFIQTQGVLFSAVIDTLGQVNDDLSVGRQMTERTRMLVEFERHWNEAQ